MDRLIAALKVFVVAGGIVIVFGVTLLVVLLVRRDGEEPITALREPVNVALPAGARVVETVPDGTRLVLTLEDEAGRQAIAVLDIRTGERLGLFVLTPAP